MVAYGKRRLVLHAAGLFEYVAHRDDTSQAVTEFYRRVGQMKVENDFWPMRLVASERRAQSDD